MLRSLAFTASLALAALPANAGGALGTCADGDLNGKWFAR